MQQVGSRYVLGTPIGRGSTGQVWRGRVAGSGVPVAIKVLDPDLARDPDTVARFVQERSILTGLSSPHLVRVRDLVAEQDTLAIVMDLVEGIDLRQHLGRVGTLAPGLAAELIGQVLGALTVVHQAGIVHRDVKPENILLDLADAEHPRALLTDFGIARIVSDPAQARPGGLAGTLGYLAPEVARTGLATPASDLYATGVVLYELLAGRLPFAASEPFELLRAHELEPPRPIPGLPEPIAAVLAQLLAKPAQQRPASAALARQELAAAAAEVRGRPALAPAPEPDRYRGPTIPPGVAMTVTDLPRALLGGDAHPEERLAGDGAGFAGGLFGATGLDDGQGPPRSEAADRSRRAVLVGLLALGLALIGVLAAFAFGFDLLGVPASNTGGTTTQPTPTGTSRPTPSDDIVPFPTTPATASVTGTTASPTSTPSASASVTSTTSSPTSTPSATVTATPSAPALPNVVGLARAEAVSQLRAAGVSTITITRSCSPGQQPDRVVAQSPAAGSPGTDAASVTLTVQDTQCLTVPNVVGMRLTKALGVLHKAGFVTVHQVNNGGKGSERRVVSQSLAAGSSVLPQPITIAYIAT